MKSMISTSACLAGCLAVGMIAQGRSVAQAQETHPAIDQQVTVTGCVQLESVYRKARDAGRGGVAGTGIGESNEFVLTNASAPMSGGAQAKAPAMATTMAYELTGTNEGQAAKFVGHRVEIAGKLKAAEVDAAGKPTGGVSAGSPPSGVDVISKDLKLRELEVATLRESTGSCPAGD